jgi:hypothetical protein
MKPIRIINSANSFKNIDKILSQTIKAWWTDYGKDKYDLANHQCEHVANSIVLGINYSSQVEDRKSFFITHKVGLNLGNFLSWGGLGGLINALC